MILFLPNTNKLLGLGNLKRCQYLKDQLVKKKFKCYTYLKKKIELNKIRKIIIEKKIRYIFIDDYRYKEKHRKLFKNLGCKIIQINFFNDNDKYIDLFINYLKKKSKRFQVINNINNSILQPYKKFKTKKDNIIMVYFSNINLNLLNKIIYSLSLNFENFKIIVISNFNTKDGKIITERNYSNIIIKKNIKNINYYFNKSKILISGGGLASLESTRYKVKNIVIYSNKYQKINSIYLKKNKLISCRFDLKKLNMNILINKIRTLSEKKIKLKSIEKKSVIKTASILEKKIKLNDWKN